MVWSGDDVGKVNEAGVVIAEVRWTSRKLSRDASRLPCLWFWGWISGALGDT